MEKTPAQRLAKYIVSRLSDDNRAISHLHLQKLLYFLWIDYYKETGMVLFPTNFYAWELGPVDPFVYRDYCCGGAQRIYPIFPDGTFPFADASKDLVDKITDEYAKIQNVFDLVKKSHEDGGAWKACYQEGKRNYIPQDTIIRYLK